MSCVVTRSSHNLCEIQRTRSGEGPGIETVVRWCCHCGGVVVDVDVDGHTDPGRRRPMEFPTLAYQAARAAQPKG